ncbi:bacterial alpha-L-rhamnosidase-domain-containing protein [Aspergillus insuetus]
MGATTMWERWDSMLADGSINPGEMTSFNHYAFGSVATFLHERVAGLQYLEAGWRRSRFAPSSSDFQPLTTASTAHLSPFGRVAGSWELVDTEGPASSEEVLHALGVPVTLGIIFLVGKIKRRTALLSGITLCVVIYLSMRISGCWSRHTKALWCVGVLLQLVALLRVSPTTAPAQTIAAKIPALRLKAKSLAIGFLLNYMFSAVFDVVMPYLFTPSEGNLGGQTGFIFLTTSIIGWLVVDFEVPETKDISYDQLDRLFLHKTPARCFFILAMTTIRLDGDYPNRPSQIVASPEIKYIMETIELIRWATTSPRPLLVLKCLAEYKWNRFKIRSLPDSYYELAWEHVQWDRESGHRGMAMLQHIRELKREGGGDVYVHNLHPD